MSMIPPEQMDIFTGPPKSAQILAIPEIKEWVEHSVAYMVQDGDVEESEAIIDAKIRAVKLFREGYFGI